MTTNVEDTRAKFESMVKQTAKNCKFLENADNEEKLLRRYNGDEFYITKWVFHAWQGWFWRCKTK